MLAFGKPIGDGMTEYTSRRTGHKYTLETYDNGEITISSPDVGLLVFTSSRSRDYALNIIDLVDREAVIRPEVEINTG